MKFFYISLLSLLAAHAVGQDLNAFEKRVFVGASGDTLRYRILVPAHNSSSKKKYPLVIFLHGAGERGGDNEKQMTHGAKLFTDSINRATYPAVVVFPQCPSNDYWSSVKIDRTT